MNDFDLAVPLMDGPSYDRACSLVPSEYVEAWEWFLGEEQRGGVWTSLPHHTKEDSPQYQYRLRIGSDFFPVTRDSGIFWPGQDRVKQDPDKIFALSVHNSKRVSIPMFLRSIWMTARGSLSIRFKRRAPLVLETKTITGKCSTAWNVAFQLESYLQLRWAIRCLALRLLNGSSPKTAGLFCMVPFIKAGLTSFCVRHELSEAHASRH